MVTVEFDSMGEAVRLALVADEYVGGGLAVLLLVSAPGGRRASRARGCRSGAAARSESCLSRACISARTFCRLVFSPFACSSARRRSARTRTSAVRKILTCAFGSTTVPMSRPSITTFCVRASSRCMSRRNARTHGCADTPEAYIDISGVRISSVTSFPLRIMCCTPSSYRISMLTSSISRAMPSLSFGPMPIRRI